MKKKLFIIFFVLSAGLSTVAGEDHTDPVFQKFKDSLNIDKEYKVYCQIATFNNSREPVIRKYSLFVKNNNSLLISAFPQRDRGQILLMVGDQIWQYFPKINKTMNINTALTINGSVNITDLLTSSVFSLYRLESQSTGKDPGTYTFFFKAKNNSAPYGSIRYFLRNGTIVYLETYARSGILLKKLFFYKHIKSENGSEYPSQIKVVNALRENDYSLIQMSDLKFVPVPDYYFNPSALDNIRPE